VKFDFKSLLNYSERLWRKSTSTTSVSRSDMRRKRREAIDQLADVRHTNSDSEVVDHDR